MKVQLVSSFSETESSSNPSEEDGRQNQRNDGRNSLASCQVSESLRHWRDVFWLCVFIVHIGGVGFVLAIVGLNRFRKPDRLRIDRYTNKFIDNQNGLTETYWPLFGVAAGVGALLGWMWLSLLGSHANRMMKMSVHGLMAVLAVISVLCFWDGHIFWGVAFGVGAIVQFLYIVSVVDRFPFTFLVLQKAAMMVWSLPEVIRVAYALMLVMLLWMAFWSFGAAGVIATSIGDRGRWWLLVVLSVSLFWTGAVLCNTVHVTVSGIVCQVLYHDGQRIITMSSRPLLRCLQHSVTTSFGSICYGSLITALVRTLRWEIRGLRSKIGGNECLLYCVDFFFHLVECLVRFFNKYAYVQIAIYGKSFNESARDAWELLQSTGIEALVAYDCSGAVLLMGTIMGGLISGSCAGVWEWYRAHDRVMMVGFTSMLMGMIMVGLAMAAVEGTVTSIYICFAEDPSLIRRWDSQFFSQMSDALHQRLQHRSARDRDVINYRPESSFRRIHPCLKFFCYNIVEIFFVITFWI